MSFRIPSSFRARCIFCALSSAILATLVLSLVQAQELPSAPPSDLTPPPSIAPAPAPSEPMFPSSPVAPSAAPKKNTKVVYKEKSYYDFEDVLINGNLRKPDGSFIFRKNTTPFSSALNLRRSFIPELKESSTNTR